MIKIAEKPWIYEDRTLKVSTQAVTGRRQEPKNPGFCANFKKTSVEKKS